MKNAASTIYFSSGSNTATARRSRTFDRPQAAPYVLGAVTGPNNKTVASDGLSSDLHEESDGDIPALRLRRKKSPRWGRSYTLVSSGHPAHGVTGVSLAVNVGC